MPKGSRDTPRRATSSSKDRAITLCDAYEDYVLAKRAIMVTAGTIGVYKQTVWRFIGWMKEHGKETVDEIGNADIRAYLAEFAGNKANYVNIQGRNLRSFTKFLLEENYISEPIKFSIPPIGRERPLVLSADDINRVYLACNTPRDKAIFLLFIDTGVRKNEFLQLNWGDVDLKNGVIVIRKGKWGKTRTVVMGVRTRRALLAYGRTVSQVADAPLIQTQDGTRFTSMGIRSYFLRLSKKSGVHITPHALRRTFATLALRAGMNPLHLQGLMGHTTLEMTRRYVQMVDEDLVAAHEAHGPIDNFLK